MSGTTQQPTGTITVQQPQVTQVTTGQIELPSITLPSGSGQITITGTTQEPSVTVETTTVEVEPEIIGGESTLKLPTVEVKPLPTLEVESLPTIKLP